MPAKNRAYSENLLDEEENLQQQHRRKQSRRERRQAREIEEEDADQPVDEGEEEEEGEGYLFVYIYIYKFISRMWGLIVFFFFCSGFDDRLFVCDCFRRFWWNSSRRPAWVYLYLWIYRYIWFTSICISTYMWF